MASIKAYKTSADASKKLTSYIVNSGVNSFALDFGSFEFTQDDVRKLSYIFITHEHMDHFVGLLKIEYVDILFKNNCKIFASKVTKDLIVALFENSIKVGIGNKVDIEKIRKLLSKINGVLFFEKYALDSNTYFKLFPSGHTYGSSMVYLSTKETKILYTGDIDYSSDDSDRQYQIELDVDETVDYVIADGTYLDSEDFKDDGINDVREKIIKRKYNNFLCKPEKIVFFAKKLMLSSKLNEKYCVVFPSELKWYLNILDKYNYNPFITDVVVLESSKYCLPENRIPLFVTNKVKEKQTNVTGLVGLHISFTDFAYMMLQFDSSKTKILVGHYNFEKKNDILSTFHSSSLLGEYKVCLLNNGDNEI